MKAYLINLDRHPVRLQRTREQLENVGVAVERIAAVNGKTISQPSVDRYRQLNLSHSPLGPTEVAVFQSHRQAWKRVAEGQDPWGFVCEDDILIDPESGPLFADTGWMPRTADIVKAETAFYRIRLSRLGTKRHGRFRMARLLSNHLGSAGYFLRRQSAARLLSMSETSTAAIDDWMFDPDIGIVKQVKVYQLQPAICFQTQLADDQQSHPEFESVVREERDLLRLPDPPKARKTPWMRVRREVERWFETKPVIEASFSWKTESP